MGRARKNLEKVPGVRIWKRSGEGESARWKLTYKNPDTGKHVNETASPDYDVTLELARRIARRIERQRLGLAPSSEDRYAEQDATPIIRHLEDWRRSMQIAGRDPKHVRQFHDNARDVLLGTPAATTLPGRGRRKTVATIKLPPLGVGRVSQVQPSKVYEQIGRIKAERSAATANRYINALNAFFNWGVPERWQQNPVAHLEKYTVAEDRKRERRAIEPGQFLALIVGLEVDGVPAVAGLTPAERSRLYRFAVQTGMRRKEIHNVRKCDLSLEGPRLGVWTRASISRKNKRRQFINLSPALAAELADAVAKLKDTDPAIKCPANTARMLRRDLERVGIDYRTAHGVFDFHAIRHQCGTLLAAAHINPKAIQRHLRHSNITLTMGTYGHLLEQDVQAIIAALPDFSHQSAQRNAQRRTVIECNSVQSNAIGNQPQPNEKPRSSSEKRGSGEWSRGESNPDLLNAIQPPDNSITFPDNDLRSKTHRGAAQGAARAVRSIRRVLRMANPKKGVRK